MNKPLKMLAFDFGASGGRAILGCLQDGKLVTEEIHRFSNDPVEVRGTFYWDVLRLFHEIKQGILKCANSGHKDIDSIAIDTWGVDFGLLDEQGNLLGNPYHYRDSHTDGMMEEAFKIIPRYEFYAKTGLQFMKFNSVFQLLALKQHQSPALKQAKTMLLMPDLFNYFLTGVKASEVSIASTTQLLKPGTMEWDTEIIDRLGLPGDIFTGIVASGTVIGSLSPELAKELGVGEIPVIAAAGHDTQAAIVSVPAETSDYAYISCGTWSLMGIESETPIINEKSDALAFTNEAGVDNKTTFLKNIMGLWLVQESKRQWDREGKSYSFAQLETMAVEAKPFESFIDPEDDFFMAPGDMPDRIREYCRKTNQPVPQTEGEIMRCIYQSLALKYRQTLESLEEVKGGELPVIHMIGGGIKDQMLCQLTANATGRKVAAGPVEATSIGNLMVQAMALGEVKDLQEARQVVKQSFSVKVYEPQEVVAWNEAYEKYKNAVKI